MNLNVARTAPVGRLARDAHAVLDPCGIIEQAFDQFGCASVLAPLRALESEVYLVGGSVRDGLAGMPAPRDIDLIVPNGSTAVHDIIGRLGPSRRNRHGNWRYFTPRGFHIDVIEPRFFYGQFEGARDVLAFFDASVNAVGIRLHDGEVLDPLGGIRDLELAQVTLPPDRWTTMSDFESVHLVLRLSRLLWRLPLRVANREIALQHLSKFDLVDWSELERLNGVSRAEAERRVEHFLTASRHETDAMLELRRARARDLRRGVRIVGGREYANSAAAPTLARVGRR